MTVFIVDQETTIADACAEILRLNGITARAFYDGQDALKAASEEPPQLVIHDVSKSELEGFAPVDEFKRRFPACQVVLMSANAAVMLDSPKTTVEVLYKPIHPTILVERVRAAQNKEASAPIHGVSRQEVL